MQLFNERDGKTARVSDSRSIGPSAPPQMRRGLALTRKQRIGLPILTLIPLLALLGIFGERAATVNATSSSLAVSVRYPERFRYRQVLPLAVTVRNQSPRLIDTIRVSLDTAYITRFSSVRITPAPSTAFTVTLAGVRPGEQRLVSAELWGQDYGRLRGRIVVSTPNDSAVVNVRTLVFP